MALVAVNAVLSTVKGIMPAAARACRMAAAVLPLMAPTFASIRPPTSAAGSLARTAVCRAEMAVSTAD
jgi:hypothetical protein